MKCEQCGRSFTPAQSRQKYCCRECKRRAERGMVKELKAMETPSCPQKVPTDWKAIGRLMADTGKSYGQLQTEGKL